MRSTDGTAADGAAMAKLIAVAPPLSRVALQVYAPGRENVTEGCPGCRQTKLVELELRRGRKNGRGAKIMSDTCIG